MIKNPTISVIMPVYNGEKYLKEAIDSILNQTYVDFEFIILNDGSTDSSESIILSYNDPRIIYVKNELNIKLIKTLNKGIDLAKGKFIARMDADDISMLNRFEKQIQVFDAFKGVDVVNVQVYNLINNGVSFKKSSLIQVNYEAIKYINQFENLVSHPGVMVKADLLKRYRYRDCESVRHVEDYDLWLRLLNDGYLFYTINDYLLYYRIHSSSINSTQSSVQRKHIFDICKKSLNDLSCYQMNDDVIKVIIGDRTLYNVSLLIKTNKELKLYIESIRNNLVLSNQGFVDLCSWRKYRMAFLCGRFFLLGNVLMKLQIIVYILFHISWLVGNKQIRDSFTFSKKYIGNEY